MHNGGLSYGIDFKGGTLVTVGSACELPVRGRDSPGSVGAGAVGDSTIQSVHDICESERTRTADSGLPVAERRRSRPLDAGKTSNCVKALTQRLPRRRPCGKVDFNSATPAVVADYLTRKDPLGLGTAAGDRYTQIAQQLAKFPGR